MSYNYYKTQMSKNIVVKIYENSKIVSQKVAKRIKAVIEKNNKEKKKTVICFPTGSTPIPLYKELKRLHKEENLSFANVISFNLDEYYPIKPTDVQSYHYFMNKHFIKHVDIKPENVHIPKGNLKVGEYEKFCEDYEAEIDKVGGFDLCLLGIGKTGHIAFNEPGSKKTDYTRLVVLHNQTRRDNSRFFNKNIDSVPQHAVTCGIGTIFFKSKLIILIATGFGKSRVIKKTLEEVPLNETSCPAAYLRDHPNCCFYLDKGAGYLLKQIKSPWEIVTGSNAITFKWTTKYEKQAVIWLSQKIGKSILTLTGEDFCSNQLSSLYYKWDYNVDKLCLNVYNDLLNRIHSEHNVLLPFKKDDRVLFFSPHPDDDISTGGIIGEISQLKGGKGIKVAYLTSGSRGVKKVDMVRHLRFTYMTLPLLLCEKNSVVQKEFKKLQSEVEKSKDYSPDSSIVSVLKKNVRKCEALNALHIMGLKEDSAEFLNLPFYNTGVDKKKERTNEDVKIVLELLRKFKPTHVVVCFDLEDPHGTHSQCYFISKEAINLYEKEGGKCVKYLYKGAWQEFDISQVSVFVPLSKSMLERKVDSIFMHTSQKDKPMFIGDDKREFYQRAKDRNFETAKKLKDIGLPSYFAMETIKIVDEFPKSITI